VDAKLMLRSAPSVNQGTARLSVRPVDGKLMHRAAPSVNQGTARLSVRPRGCVADATVSPEC